MVMKNAIEKGVNPARAGMILMSSPYFLLIWRKPRASGDDPYLPIYNEIINK